MMIGSLPRIVVSLGPVKRFGVGIFDDAERGVLIMVCFMGVLIGVLFNGISTT